MSCERRYCSTGLFSFLSLSTLPVACDSVVVYFFTRLLLLEFLFGMLCYGLFLRTADYRRRHSDIASRVLLVLVGAGLLGCLPLVPALMPEDRVGPALMLYEDRVLRWGILAALSFYLITHRLSEVRLPRLLVLVGDASYSLYLFRPYMVQLLEKVFQYFDAHETQASIRAGTAMAVCCCLSVLCYKYVEQPVTEGLRQRCIGKQKHAVAHLVVQG